MDVWDGINSGTKFQKMSVKVSHVSPGNSDQKFLKMKQKNFCNSVISYYSVSSLVFFHAITCFLKRSNRINVLTPPNEVISLLMHNTSQGLS